MKFLILGSNSFSGSHFVNEVLLRGNKVIGISRSKQPRDFFLPYKWEQEAIHHKKKDYFEFFQLDLNKDIDKIVEIINDKKPEYVVNFAAQGMVAESWQNPSHWYKTNLLSQVLFHDEIRKCKFIKKYVHISTPEIYGNTENWIKENNNFNPTTPYSVSRAACEMHLLSFYKAYNFPVVFTRAANVYGPGQQLFRIIPRTILSCKTGKKLKLHGGGYSKRAFIHIKDVVKATYNLAIEAPPGSSWHISTNQAFSIREIVSLICKMNETIFDSIVDEDNERLGKDKNYLLSSKKLIDSFNWNPEISLNDGIKDTMNWVNKNLAELSNLSWDYEHKI